MRLSRTVFRIERIVLLIGGVFLLAVNAAPRRGLIQTYSFQDSLDFSAINDSCQKRPASTGGSWSFNGCVMAIPDVKMTLGSTYAANGILDLGKCSDTGCIGTLTSVPTSGYLDSLSFSYDKLGHLFAIRTSEMNYALLYMYAWGSGLPFKAFKWAYQPDGTPDFNKPVVSDVRSGFWTLVQPSSDSNASIVDFSELNKGVNNFQSKIVARDCYFTYDSLFAPYGVFYDSTAGDQIQSRYMSGKTITLDREGLFYLDSMMKQFALNAPLTGYSMSCPTRNVLLSKNGVYFIKTSENRYAALIKTGQYIGGIDRTYFYWIYQPDSGTKLYKNIFFQLPDSLSITVDVFSGRPNPTFKLIDPSGIGEIVRQSYLSVNTLLDSTRKRTGTFLVNGKLGYRGLWASGMFGPAITTDHAPTVDVSGGLITYYNVGLISEIPPRLLYDKNSELEKLIIRVCYKNNLVSSDQYEASSRFCDLIPDSLKNLVALASERDQSAFQSAFVTLKVAPKGISYNVLEAGRIRIDLFNVEGKCVLTIADRYHDRGSYFLDVKSRHISSGFYLFKCSRQVRYSQEIMYPALIR
jgi:hypothetical protein